MLGLAGCFNTLLARLFLEAPSTKLAVVDLPPYQSKPLGRLRAGNSRNTAKPDKTRFSWTGAAVTDRTQLTLSGIVT